MTTKYDRNTLVPFGTLRNYSNLSLETREKAEAVIDPGLSAMPVEEADLRVYPLHKYTRAVALLGLSCASVAGKYAVRIVEGAFGPAENGKLSLRAFETSYSTQVPVECAADLTKLLGVEFSYNGFSGDREVIDVYRTPRSNRFYLALARKDEEQ